MATTSFLRKFDMETQLCLFLLHLCSSISANAYTSFSVKPCIDKGNILLVENACNEVGCSLFTDSAPEATNIPVIVNGDFSASGGWLGAYNKFTFENNTIGYKYGNNWECYQILDGPAGLYRLSANACGLEYSNDYNSAFSNRNKIIPTSLFINEDEMHLPSVFTEPASEDIYGHYYWATSEGYVPYDAGVVPSAFNRNMYKVEVWSFVSSTEIIVGLRNTATDNISRWAAWDNLQLTYYSEQEIDATIDSMATLAVESKLEKNVRNHTLSLIYNAKSALTYEEKSAAFLNLMSYETVLRGSMKTYSDLYTKLTELTDSIQKVNKDYLSPATYEEANNFAQEVYEAYQGESYSVEQAIEAISTMNKLMERISYTYLDIRVTVPGALGDTILSRVTNFTDVQSIKISGTLNDADYETIRSRLSKLKEADIAEVNTTAIPDRLFYQHTDLEIVKLPTQLQTIGDDAFYGCKNIKHIDFPSTLTSVGNRAFYDCDNLLEIILPEGFTSLGRSAFDSCDNNQYVKLPSSLTIVSPYAFASNKSLKSIDFSKELLRIEEYGFAWCSSLNNIVFPSSLQYIGGYSFRNNSSLSDITLNEGLYQIADNAFYDCDALKEVVLPSSLVLCHPSPFDYCDNLMKVTCLSIEPPYMTDQIPYGLGMEGRVLYVPYLSVNVYKQTAGWDKFQTVEPIDVLPKNINILGDVHFTLPEDIPADYKPNVAIIHEQKETTYYAPLEYGSLTVNGVGKLSIDNFNTVWDPSYQIETGRDQCYCSLINNSVLQAENVSITLCPRNSNWTFVSFPFNVKVSDIETTAEGETYWVIRKYDGQKRASGDTNNTWVRLENDDVLNAGEGYIIQSSRYYNNSWPVYSVFLMKAINDTLKNNIFISTDATVTLKEFESELSNNRSWNLIGNPYPCYYDIRFMDFQAPVTVWDTGRKTYNAYNPMDDAIVLSPGEAFFVQRPADKATITFFKDGRQTNRVARTLDTAARAKAHASALPHRIIANFTVNDGEHTDCTRVVLNDNALLDYEMDKDASKFMSTDTNVPQIYTTVDGINYAINERPMADGAVDLNIYAGKDDLCNISLFQDIEGYSVTLEDKAEGKSTLLSAGEEYSFLAKEGYNTGRFVIHFSKAPTGPTSIDSPQPDTKQSNTIYNINGVKVATPAQNGIYVQKGKKVVHSK